MDHFFFLFQCLRFDPSHTRLCGCMAFVGLKNEILNTTSISVAVSAHKHTSHSCFKHTDTTFSLTDVIRGWWRGISTALQDKPCVLYWSRKERLAQTRPPCSGIVGRKRRGKKRQEDTGTASQKNMTSSGKERRGKGGDGKRSRDRKGEIRQTYSFIADKTSC